MGNETAHRLRLRYPAVCATCGIALSPRSEAFWNRETKQATCLACGPSVSVVEAGAAGASAAAEGERRAARRVEQVRRRYGDHAAAVAEKVAAPEVAESWEKGSIGESKLAAYVARKVGDQVIALHDRLIPGTKRNIDHIFVAPTGIWVVDAKAYSGQVVKREVGPLWRRENEVLIGGRNRTKLAEGVDKQVGCVLAALQGDPAAKGTNVYGALCFVGAEWRLLDFPFRVGTVWVIYPGALCKRLKKAGPRSRESLEHLARRLDLSLPRAPA
jgi:hypothetical protein